MALPNVDTQDATTLTAGTGVAIAVEMDKAEDTLKEMDYTLTSVFDALVDMLKLNQRIATAVEGLFSIQEDKVDAEKLGQGLELEKEREEKRPLSDFLGYKSVLPNMDKIKDSASTFGLVLTTIAGALVAFYDELPDWAKDILGGTPGRAARETSERRYPTQIEGEADAPENLSQTVGSLYESLSGLGTDESKFEQTFGNIKTRDEFNQVMRGYAREKGKDLAQHITEDFDNDGRSTYVTPTLKRLGIDPNQFYAGKYDPFARDQKQQAIEVFRKLYFDQGEHEWLKNAREYGERLGMTELEFVGAVTGRPQYGYEAYSEAKGGMPITNEMFPNTIEALDPNSYDAKLMEMTVEQHQGKEFIISSDNKGNAISPPPPKSKIDALGTGSSASGLIDRSNRPAVPSANPTITKAISQSGSAASSPVQINNDNRVTNNNIMSGGSGGGNNKRTTPSATKQNKSSGTTGMTEVTDFVGGPM